MVSLETTNTNHNELSPGVHLYRLAISDVNGQVEYSDIRSVEITTSKFELDAKVVGGEIKIKVVSQEVANLAVEILGIGGNSILNTDVEECVNTHEMIIPCDTWRTGIYILKWQNLTTGAWGTQRMFVD